MCFLTMVSWVLLVLRLLMVGCLVCCCGVVNVVALYLRIECIAFYSLRFV